MHWLPVFGGRMIGAVFIDAGQVVNRGDEIVTLTEIKITPGFGIRLGTALGPIRLDVGYNPYEPRPSPLYEPNLETGELVLVDSNYVPESRSFLGRLRLHFSVGQAF